LKRELVKSSSFIRAAKKYAKYYPDFVDDLNDTLNLLKENAFDSKLKTHKLKGELEGFWACSLYFDLRIIFRFVKARDKESDKLTDSIMLATIGTHDEVY
jgi:addiction module RelE/StbE family toxin